MPPVIRIPNVSLSGYDQSFAGSPVSWQAESDAILAMQWDNTDWVLYLPPSQPPTELNPGIYTPFNSPPPPWPQFASGPYVAFVREKLPRNIIWAGAAESPLADTTLADLAASDYTHIIVCFLHFDPGLKLVYNGPTAVDAVPAGYWDKVQALKQGAKPKTVMVSLGGYGSGSWAAMLGQETQAATLLAGFVNDHGFDGVDINFEGGPSYAADDPDFLTSVGKLVVQLRLALPRSFVTITPMTDIEAAQLRAITTASVQAGFSLTAAAVVSWVNVQFDTYSYAQPDNDPQLVERYAGLVAKLGLPASQLTAGFGLWGESGTTPDQAPQYGADNLAILWDAREKIGQLIAQHPDFGGVFGWNYHAAKQAPNFGWDSSVSTAMCQAYASPGPFALPNSGTS